MAFRVVHPLYRLTLYSIPMGFNPLYHLTLDYPERLTFAGEIVTWKASPSLCLYQLTLPAFLPWIVSP